MKQKIEKILELNKTKADEKMSSSQSCHESPVQYSKLINEVQLLYLLKQIKLIKSINLFIIYFQLRLTK